MCVCVWGGGGGWGGAGKVRGKRAAARLCVCGGGGGGRGGFEIVIDMLNQTHNRFKRTFIYFDTDTVKRFKSIKK